MAHLPRPSQRTPALLAFLCAIGLTTACSDSGSKTQPDPPIILPAPFSFTGITGAEFDAEITSEAVTITGINDRSPICIDGGLFSINGGTFASTPTHITNNQTVQVKVQSPIKAETTQSATLRVGATISNNSENTCTGGVSATFTATTGPDTTPPEVTIHFPPPASMTEGEEIFMRGSVRDLHGRIESLSIEGHEDVEVELMLNETGDQGEWQVTVPLEVGLNILNLVAEDGAGNQGNDAGIQVTQAPITSAFPDNEVPFDTPTGIALSIEAGSATAYVVEFYEGQLISVDLATGHRHILSSNETQTEEPFALPMYITKGENNLLYIGDRRSGQIYILDKDTGTRRLLDLEAIEEFNNEFYDLGRLDYDHERHLIYATKGPYIFSINPIDGKMAILAQILDADIHSLEGLTIDPHKQTILTSSLTPYRIILTSLDSGTHETINAGLFSIEPRFGPLTINNQGSSYVLNRGGNIIYYPNIYSAQNNPQILGENYEENQIKRPWDLILNAHANYLLVTDTTLKGIFAVDTVSGRRVILSKSGSN